MKKEKKEITEENKKQKHRKREVKEKKLKDSFDDALEEALDDDELYNLLKNMRD